MKEQSRVVEEVKSQGTRRVDARCDGKPMKSKSSSLIFSYSRGFSPQQQDKIWEQGGSKEGDGKREGREERRKRVKRRRKEVGIA